MSNYKTTFEIILDTLALRPGERLTSNQLSGMMVRENKDWAERKRSNSQNESIRTGGFEELRAQVQSEIGSHRDRIEKHPSLRMTEDRPRKYYFTTLTQTQEIEAIEEDSQFGRSQSFSEHDLYPVLVEYLKNDLGVYAKRIDEKRSKNKNGSGGNKWLYPDLIGFEVLSEKWTPEIKQLVQARSDPSSRLWSFEVKKLINRSNAREVFFQALSNSAWANLGYLVAAEISGTGTLDELRLLSSQHGIGIILLSTSLDTESTILIQAKEKSEVDWTAANRLSDENSDAEAVFRQVRVFHQAGELHKSFWSI